MPDLSIIIPARNEEWLAQTIADILSHSEGDTEIIAVLDGAWANPPIPDHPRVRLVKTPQPIGQRAATNLGVRLSTAQFVMKLDAHCSLDQGFDVKLMQADSELDRPDVTQIPAQINLHVFNWRCKACGRETYQGPEPVACVELPDGVKCELNVNPPACGKSEGFERVLIWQPRTRKAVGNGSPGRGGPARTEFWRFDHDFHFFYWQAYGQRPEAQGELVDVMSSLGACFFMRRSRFHEIGGLDEAAGSWGGFGSSIALKSWLSGGRQIVNRRTFFCHAFRTQGGSWSFPYPNPQSAVDAARDYIRRVWLANSHPVQRLPLSWLLEKFWPVPSWSEPVGSERLQMVRKDGARFISTRSRVLALADQTAERPVLVGSQRMAEATTRTLGNRELANGGRESANRSECSASATEPISATDSTDATPFSTAGRVVLEDVSTNAVSSSTVIGGDGARSSQVNGVRNEL